MDAHQALEELPGGLRGEISSRRPRRGLGVDAGDELVGGGGELGRVEVKEPVEVPQAGLELQARGDDQAGGQDGDDSLHFRFRTFFVEIRRLNDGWDLDARAFKVATGPNEAWPRRAEPAQREPLY